MLFLSAVSGALYGESAVFDDEFPAFLHGDGWKLFTGIKVVLGFTEDPWVLHGGASDHDAVYVCGFASEFDVCSGCDVTISYYG